MIQNFIAELQRRKVLRVATGYVVAAWIILQVAVAVAAHAGALIDYTSECVDWMVAARQHVEAGATDLAVAAR